MNDHPWLTTVRPILDMSCLNKLIPESLNGLGVPHQSVEEPDLQVDLRESALWLLLFVHLLTVWLLFSSTGQQCTVNVIQ